METRRALVTGASGFVGRHLVAQLRHRGVYVRAAVRSPSGVEADDIRVVDIDQGDADWRSAVDGIDTVFHLAARVHRRGETGALDAYRASNRDATLRLAEAAPHVRHFTFVSTVKVLGEETAPGSAFTESDPLQPQVPYAISKAEAERGLIEMAGSTSMKISIIRPPLVYGPGVRANFLSLMRAVQKGIPLPLGGIDNSRSLVYVGNLADAVVASAAGSGGTYLISDCEFSSPHLAEAIGEALGRRPRLIRLPHSLLQVGRNLPMVGGAVARLTTSLVVDSSRIRRELHWTPPFTATQGFAATARWYIQQASH